MFKKTLLLSGIALCLLGTNDASVAKRMNDASAMKKRTRLPAGPANYVDTRTPEQKQKERETIAKANREYAEKLELAKKGASIPTPIKVVDEAPETKVHEAINTIMQSVDSLINETTGNPLKLNELKHLFLSQENLPYALAALNSFDGTNLETEEIMKFIGQISSIEGLDNEFTNVFDGYFVEKSNESSVLGKATRAIGEVIGTGTAHYIGEKILDYFSK